ncbi:MAG: PstS family phosphate ABC transporter substrate-binding protein [Culicoidibacterales bacterium]
MRIGRRCMGVVLAASLLLAACAPDTTGNSDIRGKIRIDGSATVAPVTQAVVEEYSKEYRNVEVTISVSGTGGGFKKFANGETDISNASRKIKTAEIEQAQAKMVRYEELEIGKDAIVFSVSNENTWAKNLTVEQLRDIWKADSTIFLWSDLNPAWPKEKIKLYAPATDAGTYDYFHSEVMGKDTQMRSDYTASQDSNVLVTGVSGDKYSLGFFGFVYYSAFSDKLQAVSIDNVFPTLSTINEGTYKPLSRGLYIYVNMNHYDENIALQKFVAFYLDHASELTTETGYPPLTDEAYEQQKQKIGL